MSTWMSIVTARRMSAFQSVPPFAARLRDSLTFVNFNEFKNQIEWAQYGKSFNTHVNGMLLEKLPRDGLTGKTIKATGAYPLPAKGQLPQFVPATITVGGGA